MDTSKKLYRSRTNRVISGVMGGLGEYSSVDPVLVRIVYITLTAFTAVVPGVLAYILMAMVMPENPAEVPVQKAAADEHKDETPET